MNKAESCHQPYSNNSSIQLVSKLSSKMTPILKERQLLMLHHLNKATLSTNQSATSEHPTLGLRMTIMSSILNYHCSHRSRSTRKPNSKQLRSLLTSTSEAIGQWTCQRYSTSQTMTRMNQILKKKTKTCR